MDKPHTEKSAGRWLLELAGAIALVALQDPELRAALVTRVRWVRAQWGVSVTHLFPTEDEVRAVIERAHTITKEAAEGAGEIDK